MLPVSWQIGCDLFLARAMFWSMILNAFAAREFFFSFSKEVRMARWTSSGISADVRRISSTKESCNWLINLPQRKTLRQGRQLRAVAFRGGAGFNLRVQSTGNAADPGKFFTPLRFGVFLALLVFAAFPQVVTGLQTF